MVARSWTFKEKWIATGIVSAFTFISPVSSSMIAPATSQLAKEFGITSSVVEAMAVSVFILGYGTFLAQHVAKHVTGCFGRQEPCQCRV